MSAPYTPPEPIFQIQATVIAYTEAEAVELAEWITGTYTGEALVFRRTGVRPDITLERISAFGVRP